MSVNELIKLQKKLKAITLVCALVAIVLAAYFWYHEMQTGESHKGWFLTCLILAGVGALFSFKLNSNISKEEKGKAGVQRIIDCVLAYFRTVASDEDSRLFTALVLTLMQRYLAPAENAEVESIIPEEKRSGECEIMADEYKVYGEKIVERIFKKFDEGDEDTAARYFKMTDEEKAMFIRMSKAVQGTDAE